jgi:hypothetical protein
MSTQAIQEPQIPGATTNPAAADPDAEHAVEAGSILAAVSQAKRDHQAGKVSKEDYLLTVDDLGVSWRSLFRVHALLGTHVPEEALDSKVAATSMLEIPAPVVPDATMYALVTDQGTAMSEAALCASCYVDPQNQGYAEEQAGAAGDWDRTPWIDASENDALACAVCGRDSLGNTQPDED